MDQEVKRDTEDDLTLITYEQLGEWLECSTQTARQVVAAGHIPLVKISPRVHRVRLSDVKSYIRSGGIRADA